MTPFALRGSRYHNRMWYGLSNDFRLWMRRNPWNHYATQKYVTIDTESLL